MARSRTRNQQSFVVEELHDHDMFLDEREIFFHSYIDNIEHDPGVDYRNANKFIKNLRYLESLSHHPIVVHLSTPGGCWCYGMMVYDAIAACQAHVIVLMHGIAWSMGTIIPQAADKRVMMPNASFMVHQGGGNLGDESFTFKQLMSWTDLLKKTEEKAIEIYTEICQEGKFFQDDQYDETKIKEYLRDKMSKKEDWYLNARETVYFGFADAVLGDEGYENIDVLKNI